jgi:nicotinate-nucleotide adenylyltransferase
MAGLTVKDDMKIGVFGGSFDPPHEAHLAMARLAIDKFSLDKILFVPCFQNPLKDITGHASPFHRYVMAQLASLVEDDFLVTPLEIRRQGISYTIDTLKDLSKTGYELFLIMGLDAFRTIGKWKDSDLFHEYCNLIVFTRDGYDSSADDHIPQSILDSTFFLNGFDMKISSTEIRKAIRDGGSTQGFIPTTVKLYIDKYELYRHFRDQNRLIDDPIKEFFIKG